MTKVDINYTAKLSYLSYEEKDIEKVEKGLGDILNYVTMLSDVDTQGVKPLTHVMETVNVLREDEVGETLSIEDVEKNAPDWEDRTFKVPKVM